ncbi:MFS transporter, partial [bacterium]|nr:MFS transporter [bacterium]
VAKQEKGTLNGYMQAGMLTGRSIFGGAALIFIPTVGLTTTVALMIASILSIMLLRFSINEPVTVVVGTTKLVDFKKNLLEIFRQKQTWYTIAFALTAAAAFEAAGGMSGAFLTDQHMDMKSIGFFFGVPVVVAMTLGGLAGGFLSDKMSRKKSVTVFLFGFVLLIAAVSVNGSINPHASDFMWMSLFAGMYFFTGMFTASSYALFMDVTDPKLGATEFSTFMAATNGCEAWVVWSAGILAASHGYSVAFLIMCVVSLFSLFFLWKIDS